jgi:hypothetical protein
MLIAGYVVFHSGHVGAVVEGKHFADDLPAETRLEGMRFDTHLYSSDTKRLKTAQLEEESVLSEALEHRGTAAERWALDDICAWKDLRPWRILL